MSEENNDGQQAGEQQQENEFTPITSQEEFERALGKRLERERSKFADYDDLKAKASKFDEVEEANKSEIQKAQERATAAEQRAAQAEQTALKTRIAAEMNVPVEVLHGDDEESVKASAQRVLDWANEGKKAPPKPSSLRSGSSGGGEAKQGKAGAAAALRALRGAE